MMMNYKSSYLCKDYFQIPALDKAMFKTKYDWQYLTTDDGRSNQAHINGSIIWPRGKLLGGSSNLNAMLYVKGSPHDYKSWYDAGNSDWHPDVVQKYYKRAENYEYQKLLQNTKIKNEYGHSGPLVINRFNSTYRELTKKVLDSWSEIGMENVADLNAADNIGSGIAAVTAANGIRQSADIAYLKPILGRPNLKVLTNTLCTEVVIDESTNEVIGVRVERNEKK